MTAAPLLRVALVPMPNFTMLALAGFIDTLRLAADEGDRSRPIRCHWAILGKDRRPIKASSGVEIQPHDDLISPTGFDYVVVVGGQFYEPEKEQEVILSYLRGAAAAGVPLVGLCNGVSTLARAGLMHGRRACVSWFHHLDYAAEFTDIRLVSDRMFLVDGNRITCPGGVGSIHLASWLVERHLGEGEAAKGLRIMLEDGARPPETLQPVPTFASFPNARDLRVKRGLLTIERTLDKRLALSDLASMVGSTPRNLTRLFLKELGMTPKAAQEQIRITHATRMLLETQWSIAQIADECGFADASHLIRRFRAIQGNTPADFRKSTARHSPSSIEKNGNRQGNRTYRAPSVAQNDKRGVNSPI